MLLHCIEEAEAVLSLTGASAEDCKIYDIVLKKFDNFIIMHCNEIYEQARLNCRSQQAGETSEQFIMVVYELADYGALKDEMIRNRLHARH